MRDPLSSARHTLLIEARALEKLAERLDEHFTAALAMLLACNGRIVCSGMGKAGLVMKKVAATLASTGTPAFFLHPAEAMHGDLGMLVAGDLLLVASASGGTREVVALAQLAKSRRVTVVALCGQQESALAKHADQLVPVEVEQEACPLELAPTTSTTALMALGDALAIALMEQKGFTASDFASLHPGGQLGASLRPVREAMVPCPVVALGASLQEALRELNEKKLGIVGVVEQGRLVGCLSDGDVRRLVARGEPLSGAVEKWMHQAPRVTYPQALWRDARALMHKEKITSLFVNSLEGALLGVVHIHHLSIDSL
jgi:arabinose-5-phosphate isomerase